MNSMCGGAGVEVETDVAVFKRENAKDVWSEITPLLEQHWREIAHYQDIPLSPNRDAYVKMDEQGILRVYTARAPKLETLLGYCVFFVAPHPHYGATLYAAQDVLFIRKEWRGKFGACFIAWCDEQLREQGVKVVTQHVKAAHDFGRLLERLGYELQDKIYSRRLDRKP